MTSPPEVVDLSPVRFAELVAPAVTRTFVAGIRSGGAEGRELVTSYGGGEAVGYLIDLRNPLAAGRRLTLADLAAVYRYHEPDRVRETVRGSVAHGLLAEAPDGSITAADRGREFLRELYARHGRALSERWGTGGIQTGGLLHPDRLDRLNATLARVLAAAADTGGAAWAVQAPPHEPPGTPPGVLLLNRLSTLRYHRADAHAAAWQAAGLTAADMEAMPWGSAWGPAAGGARRARAASEAERQRSRAVKRPERTLQREAVEQDTNRRAAAPYQVLTPDQRLTLLADLAGLV